MRLPCPVNRSIGYQTDWRLPPLRTLRALKLGAHGRGRLGMPRNGCEFLICGSGTGEVSGGGRGPRQRDERCRTPGSARELPFELHSPVSGLSEAKERLAEHFVRRRDRGRRAEIHRQTVLDRCRLPE